MRRAATGILLYLLAACATPQVPKSVSWPSAPRDFASPDQLIEAAARFPESGGLLRRRLALAVQARDGAAALDTLRRLAAMGAVLSRQGLQQVTGLIEPSALTAVSAALDANAKPIQASRLYGLIPAENALVEGLAWDPQRRRLYATTVVEGKLLLIGDAPAATLASPAAGSLMGAAYNPRDQRIWAASAVIEPTSAVASPSPGLVSIDPRSGGDVRRIPAPADVQATPGDVAIASDGNIYVSDGQNGALYICRPGCRTLETLLPAGTLFSSQGMALSHDQRLLYIADRRYGIAALERSSGRLLKVSGGAGMMLDGIDGLARHGRDLIATQTAWAPARIVRLRLSADGLHVAGLDVLERAHPEWGEITLGQVVGDRYIYVADAQYERYGAGGVAVASMPPRPTPLRVIDLSR